MRQSIIFVLSFFLVLTGCTSQDPPEKKPVTNPPSKQESEFPVEKFIQSHLLTDDYLLRTNITDRDQEYLSESLGLYMLFLVERGRTAEFSTQVDVLKRYFLDDSNMIFWKLDQSDQRIIPSPVNAWIDDARIARALHEAAKAFNEPKYAKLANQIGTQLASVGTKKGLPVDFVDLKTNDTSDTITLSYLDEAALRWMNSSTSLYENSRDLLVGAPIDGPFFAKSYSLTEKSYTFDDEINMIDQLYVALRYEQFDLSTEQFYLFFKEAFDIGPIYGRYHRSTQASLVDYESQAVYALAVFYLLERGELDFAKAVMDRLRHMAVQDASSDYLGGYIDTTTKHTHSFDNLLPLLAEGRLLNGHLVP